MSLAPPATRAEYLDRLRDLLPARESPRILVEVEGLLEDRMDAAVREEGLPRHEAERRALTALGPPETLADRLLAAPLQVDRTTRRAFVLWFGVLGAGHLLVSAILAAAGGEGAAIPGLLAPLDGSSLPGLLSQVLATLFMDLGILFAVFALLGRGRAPSGLPRLRLTPTWSARDSVQGAVLVLLTAVLLLPPVRDALLAVRSGGVRHPLLAPEVTAVLPWAYGVLGLVLARQVLCLVRSGEGTVALAIDFVASLAGVVFLGAVVTRGDLVRLPGSLGPEASGVLEDLITRLLLLILVVWALALAVRCVKRAARLRDLLA